VTDYAEAEVVGTTWLRAQFSTARVVTETPADLDTLVAAGTPVIAVSRFGGVEDDQFYTFDNASLDFDCYAATRGAARTLAHQVRSSIIADLPGQTVSGAFILRTQTITAPIWTPYANTKVRRFTYAAQIRLHSPEAS
jgi:hypothetical protein